eukprot:356307-Chlamydomonas_euryale.AAC.1
MQSHATYFHPSDRRHNRQLEVELPVSDPGLGGGGGFGDDGRGEAAAPLFAGVPDADSSGPEGRPQPPPAGHGRGEPAGLAAMPAAMRAAADRVLSTQRGRAVVVGGCVALLLIAIVAAAAATRTSGAPLNPFAGKKPEDVPLGSGALLLACAVSLPRIECGARARLEEHGRAWACILQPPLHWFNAQANVALVECSG